MAKAGTRDAVAVNQAMRAMPVDWFGETVTLRQDGRLLVPVTTYRVKAPGDSKAPFDYYQAIGRIGPDQAFLPQSPACATSRACRHPAGPMAPPSPAASVTGRDGTSS